MSIHSIIDINLKAGASPITNHKIFFLCNTDTYGQVSVVVLSNNLNLQLHFCQLCQALISLTVFLQGWGNFPEESTILENTGTQNKYMLSEHLKAYFEQVSK